MASSWVAAFEVLTLQDSWFEFFTNDCGVGMAKNEQVFWASGFGSNIESSMVAVVHLVCLLIFVGPGVPELAEIRPFEGISLMIWQVATFITGVGLISSTIRLSIGHVVVLVAGFFGEAYFHFGARLHEILTLIQAVILFELVLIVVGYYFALKLQQKRLERQAAFLRKHLELRKTSGTQS